MIPIQATSSANFKFPNATTVTDLPLANTVPGSFYVVRLPTGHFWNGTRKKAGLYESYNGKWEWRGILIDKVTTAEINSGAGKQVRRFSINDIKAIVTKSVAMRDKIINIDNLTYIEKQKSDLTKYLVRLSDGKKATGSWADRATLTYT